MPVYFAHATCFCGPWWRPVLESLGELDTVTWDFAGHDVSGWLLCVERADRRI